MIYLRYGGFYGKSEYYAMPAWLQKRFGYVKIGKAARFGFALKDHEYSLFLLDFEKHDRCHPFYVSEIERIVAFACYQSIIDRMPEWVLQ